MAQRVTRYSQLVRAVRPLVKKSDLASAIQRCEDELSRLRHTDYHAASGRSWLAQKDDAARWLTEFYRTAVKTMPIRSLYCEMNRFEINTDAWYLDAFAYDCFGETGNLGWLVGWKQNSGEGCFTLRGMEDLQALFARDRDAEPPEELQTVSEVVTLLLTLRMQELVCAASRLARQSGLPPESVPVLAAAHDSDLVCCCYGSVKPSVTLLEPARPTVIPSPSTDADLAVYRINGGYDGLGNSLPWDLLNYSQDSDFEKYGDRMKIAAPLAESWTPPRVSLRKRKWRCDLLSLYPHWAVNEKTRSALAPLLSESVEFLPLDCPKFPQLWVMHPLHHLDLRHDAEHNALPGQNMTVIRRYAFEPRELEGKHLFGVSQAAASDARRLGICFAANYVSEEFQRLVATNALQGIVFEKVFSHRTGLANG